MRSAEALIRARVLLVLALAGCRDGSTSADAAATYGPTVVSGRMTIWEERGQTTADAVFLEHREVTTNGCGCSESRQGSCRVVACATGPDCAGNGTTTDRYFSAGTITVTRPSGPALRLPPPNSGGYWPVSQPGGAGAPGQTVTVEATGDQVPAFRATGSIPEPLELSEGLPTTVPANEPIRVRWRPAPTGLVEVSVKTRFMPDMRGSESTRICTAPAQAGELVLDPVRLPSDEHLSFGVRRLTETSLTAGSFPVVIQLVTTQLMGNARLVSGGAGGADGGAALDANGQGGAGGGGGTGGGGGQQRGYQHRSGRCDRPGEVVLDEGSLEVCTGGCAPGCRFAYCACEGGQWQCGCPTCPSFEVGGRRLACACPLAEPPVCQSPDAGAGDR